MQYFRSVHVIRYFFQAKETYCFVSLGFVYVCVEKLVQYTGSSAQVFPRNTQQRRGLHLPVTFTILSICVKVNCDTFLGDLETSGTILFDRHEEFNADLLLCTFRLFSSKARHSACKTVPTQSVTYCQSFFLLRLRVFKSFFRCA